MKMDCLLGFFLLYFGSMFLFVVVVMQDYNCWWECDKFECDFVAMKDITPVYLFIVVNDIAPIC
jgi:hypothetical protein